MGSAKVARGQRRVYDLHHFGAGTKVAQKWRAACAWVPNHYVPYLGSAKVAHDRRTNTKLAPRSQIWWRKGDASLRRPAQTTILFSGASASAISLFPAQISYSSSK